MSTKHGMVIAAELSGIGRRYGASESTVALGAIMQFLAVLQGNGDRARLLDLAEIAQRFAEHTLGPDADTEEIESETNSKCRTLEEFLQRGVDIAYQALRERKWEVANEAMAKIVYLDELITKIRCGEVVSLQEWPDVIVDDAAVSGDSGTGGA